MKLCTGCKYATPRYSNITFCMHSNNIATSKVDSELEFVSTCGTLRDSNDKEKCGPDAKWFAPKETA